MTPDRRTRVLLVDYGGVLTTSVTTSFAAFCLATGVKPEALKALLADAYADGSRGLPSQHSLADLVVAVETGAISGEEFDRQLAPALSEGLETVIDHTGLTARLFAEISPDDAMIDAVRTARGHGVRTGLISNTWGATVQPIDQAGLFDVRILSGEVRLRKPQPEIYRLAADRLGVPADACVFVD